jgi:hypothetical protein
MSALPFVGFSWSNPSGIRGNNRRNTDRYCLSQAYDADKYAQSIGSIKAGKYP